MSPSPHKDMTLNANGFGPIAEAENVRIKPMTVFVGPSNTGKSYLATLFYAISRGMDDAQHWLNLDEDQGYGEHWYTLLSGLRQMHFNNESFEVKLPQHQSEDLVAFYRPENSEELLRSVDHLHSDWLEFTSTAIQDSIPIYFNVRDIRDLTNQHKDSTVGIRFDLHRHNDSLNWWMIYSFNQLKTDASPWPIVFPKHAISDLIKLDGRDAVLYPSLTRVLTYYVSDSFLDQFSGPDLTRYFPAARSGILATHRILNRNIIASAGRSRGETDAMLQNNPIINDFLENLLRIHPDVLNPDEQGVRLAEIIETSLMNGELKAVKSQYGPPDFIYSQNGSEIPFTRSSSMVTELAPIVLALKHFLGSKHTVIIEEPEAHLHPFAQQKFAAALALMVRNGSRIIITTHSHYMVEQISDFVAASNLSPEKRRELLRLGPVLEEQDIYLNEDEVGVYGFDNSSGSTIVKNIPFDENYAYVPEDHNLALTEQFNRNVRIIRAQSNGHSVNGDDSE